MRKIKIISDSSCDLSYEEQKELDVEVVSFQVSCDGKTFIRDLDRTKDEFYKVLIDDPKLRPKTACPLLGDYVESFEKYANDYDIICLCLTSKFSSSYTTALMAKEMCEEEGQDEDIIPVFMALLNRKINEAKDMLIERFEYICSQPASSAKFMYENNTMAGYVPEEGIRSALKHGTLALGQLGLAETLQILIGCDHTEKTGMDLAKKIEQLFKERCAEYKEKYKLNFGVYYTPAESLCYTAMKKFQQKYGIIPNVSDREYFTNSIHVPVWKELSPFEKIDIESQLTGYSSAGCITYVEMPSGVKNNVDALEQIVKYAMNKDIPYFAINVPVDTCLNCGYSDEINDKCPECGSSNIQHLRRVTGYLTNDYKTAFNYGKQKETEDRVKHAH